MAKKSIKKNYIFNLIYQITTIIIPIIVTPHVAKALLADGVGDYSFSSSLISFFTLFAALGFSTYGQREIAKSQDNKPQQTKTFLEIVTCRTFFVGVALLVNLSLILSGSYGSHTMLMKILSINIIAVAFDITFFFHGNENFGIVAIRNLIIKVIGTVLIFTLVNKKGDLWIYTLINAGMVLFGNITLFPMLRKYLVKTNLKDFKPFSHLRSTLRLFIPTVAISLYTILDKSLIGFITKNNEQNGYYEQAEKIVKIAITAITCLDAVMATRNANEFANGNIKQVNENVYKSSNFVWLLGLPMAFGFCIIASNLVPWFLGSDFDYCITLIRIFSPLTVIIGFGCLFGTQYLIPHKKDYTYTICVVSGAVTNLVLNIPLIYLWGALGATIATIAAETVIATLMLLFVRKELSIKKIFASSWKPAIASAIMFGAVYPWARLLSPSILHTIAIFCAAVAVYAIAVLALREPFVWYYAKHFAGKVFKKKNNDKMVEATTKTEDSTTLIAKPQNETENIVENQSEKDANLGQNDEQK